MDSFELPVVNRSLLIVFMKQPYVDWANQLPDRSVSEINAPLTLDSMNDDPAAYLVPEILDEDELEAFLERAWRMIFESQLSSWSTDQELWPKKLTPKMFIEWFEISFSFMVTDLWSKEELDYVE
jgi:hypothetical protein